MEKVGRNSKVMSCLKRKIAFRSASKFPRQIAFPKKPSQDPIKKKRKRKKKPSQDSNNQVIPLISQFLKKKSYSSKIPVVTISK